MGHSMHSFTRSTIIFWFQRKLSRPEYKEVDKQYKIAMVKKETTEVAVEDLQKYQAALDQVRK